MKTASPEHRLKLLARQISVCTKCPLHTSRTCAVPGEGQADARVMLIGEAPGREEDRTGRPFVGAAGRYLDQVLAGTGFDRSQLFITSTVKCRPPNNRTPRKVEVDTCTTHYLFAQIEAINPTLVVLMGAVAAKKVLGISSVTQIRGKIIEHEGRKFFVTYHPAVRFYRDDLAAVIEEDFAHLRKELERLKEQAAAKPARARARRRVRQEST